MAAAGAGKTTYIVRLASKLKNCRILVTTFTDANTDQLRKKLFAFNIGRNAKIDILPWYTFLLKEMIRPYQGVYEKSRITSLLYTGSNRSGQYKRNDDLTQYITEDKQIFSDKLSKFACKIDEEVNSKSANRLATIYDYLFIDEVQDMNGFDLDLLHRIAHAFKNQGHYMVMAGDVRQAALQTHNDALYPHYNNGKIADFFNYEASDVGCKIDYQTLKHTWRCNQLICDVANRLFPQYEPMVSRNETKSDHDGVFFLRERFLNDYYAKYKPQVLRWDSRTKTIAKPMNYGQSKGLEFDRVLLYPTTPIRDWFSRQNTELKDVSLCKLYIALTRAKSSVAILLTDAYKVRENWLNLIEWKPE